MRRLLGVIAVAALVTVASASSADTFEVRVLSQTSSIITLGWDPQPGYGYLFSANGVLVSRTNDATKTSVRFSKNPQNSYDVDVIVKGANGHCCNVPPPPPPPTATISQNIAANQTLSGTYAWRAVFDANGDSIEDDPGSVRFLVDSVVVLEEVNPPFGDTDGFFDTTTLSNAQHTFRVDAISDTNALVATNSVTANVSNVVTPPPAAQCGDGLDNDVDGFIDYPADPGCTSATDTDETDPTPPPTGTASVFVSPSGNDANSCTQAAPCRSFSRAYRVAQPGQIVEIAGGSYPTQSVSPDPTKTANDVIFRPAAGATVNVDGFYRWGASHTTVDGAGGDMNVSGFEVSDPASTSSRVTDITFRNIDFRGEQSQVLNVDGLTMQNLDIGGVTWGGDALRFNDPVGTSGDANDPANVLLENSRISGVAWPNSGDHPDGIAVSAGNNLTFRANKLWEMGSQGLYLISELGGNIHDVMIENNMFGDCRTPGAYSNCVNSLILDIRSPGLKNITVRNNSFAVGQQPMRVSGGTSGTNIQVYGNAGEGPGCEAYATYAYNVWSDAKCSTTDLTANPLFVSNASGASFDLHLQAGSPAIDRGDPSRFPATDYDGQARTSIPDAGADER